MDITRGFFKDEGKLWSSPFRIKKKDLFLWLPVVSLTAVSIHYDEILYRNIKSCQTKHSWISNVSTWITLGGDGTLDMGIATAFYLGGIIFKDDKAMQTGMLTALALGHAGLIISAGKQLSSRQRPSIDQTDKWHWFPNGIREFTKDSPRSLYDAFPSGHAISVWSVATVVAKQYKNTIWIPLLCYTLATATGISRITEDTHWVSDVILGSALGYGIGSYMVKIHSKTKWTVFPSHWDTNLLLTGRYNFR